MTFQLYDKSGSIENLGNNDTAVTIGVFDGVHLGHKALVEQLSTIDKSLSPLVVTLTSHPSYVLGRRSSEYWLDDPDEHLRLLFKAGAKHVAVLPFTQEVAQMSACQMARLLYDKIQMRSLLLGYDSRFGSKSNDDFERLPQLAADLGFTIHRGEPFLVDGDPISSSRIRTSLANGTVEETTALLGHPYSISGIVHHGRGVGHTLGFPTANVDLSHTRKMLPADGVYIVSMADHIGMANLGAAPTFAIDKPTLEVHLLDYQGDLYGISAEVQFLHRLRQTKHFNTIDALQKQLQHDLEQVRRWS